MNKNKKVLYAFYHGSAFGWILMHRLTVHKYDEAYLMVSSIKEYHCIGYSMRDYLERFVEAGLFKKIYTFNPLAGVDGNMFDTLDKSETNIRVILKDEFQKQKCDLREFDAIYNHTDGVDSFGIYLAMKGIKFSWFESTRDANVFHINRGFFSSPWYLERKGYRDVVYKYKTILGENEYETIVLLPKSEKSIEYYKGKNKKIEFFDQEKAVYSISPEQKK